MRLNDTWYCGGEIEFEYDATKQIKFLLIQERLTRVYEKVRPVAIYLKLLTTNRFMLKGTLNPEREINDIGDEETENSEGFKGRHLAPLLVWSFKI